MASERYKNFAFILYPESAPQFLTKIEDLHVPTLISPLHDQDIVEGTFDQKKKPHYHVLLEFESVKSITQVLSLVSPLGISYVEPVNSRPAYERYLCHLDSSTKIQYDPKKVVALNGAVYLADDEKAEYATLKEIIEIVRDMKPRPSPEQFVDLAIQYPSWVRVMRIPMFYKMICSYLRG